jgi:hypothetical protein
VVSRFWSFLSFQTLFVSEAGVEPARPKALAPKTSASANFATRTAHAA